MIRKLGFTFLIAQILALPLLAADHNAAISGFVRSAAGTPQMGVVVEVAGAAAATLHAFTNEDGFYSIRNLAAGTYSVKASSPSFLPASRENISVANGVAAVVDLTLNSLFQAVQLSPRKADTPGDDWQWVLRSAANRPILRFQNGVSSPSNEEHAQNSFRDVKGTLSFVAGSSSEGFGASSDMSTDFSLEKPVMAGTMALSGNVGYGSSTPATVLRAAFSKGRDGMAGPSMSLTVRSLASPDLNLHNSDFQSVAMTTSDEIQLGDVLELKFGSELQTIQFMGRVSTFRPFGSATVHLSSDTVLQYAYATSEPNALPEKGFDPQTADLSESGPRMSITGLRATLERAHHQEVSATHRMGRSSLQMAAYTDRISDPALTGIGAYSSVSGQALPDVYSGTFTYRGGRLNTQGVRVSMQRDLTSNLTAILDYAYGGALELDSAGLGLDDIRSAARVRQHHAISGKLKGTLPGTKTYWIASYRWTGGSVLTPVDLFNSSAGQADPYLNLFIRQPIPGNGFLPNHLEAMIDLRNLLAQGYVPVIGQDGRTVYLVQSARSVRAGLAFVF